MVPGARYGTALAKGARDWPRKVLLVVFITGTIMIWSMGYYSIVAQINDRSKSMVSYKERLSDIRMTVSLMTSE